MLQVNLGSCSIDSIHCAAEPDDGRVRVHTLTDMSLAQKLVAVGGTLPLPSFQAIAHMQSADSDDLGALV